MGLWNYRVVTVEVERQGVGSDGAKDPGSPVLSRRPRSTRAVKTGEGGSPGRRAGSGSPFTPGAIFRKTSAGAGGSIKLKKDKSDLGLLKRFAS